MAKRPVAEDRVAPSISPHKAIELLRKQVERADEIRSLRFDDPRVRAWQNTTEQIVVWTFGKPHDNVAALDSALNPPSFISEFTTDDDLQGWHFREIRNSVALLEGFIEQLELLASVREETQHQGLAKVLSNKVFIVHGHAQQPKTELAYMLSRMGLEPVILHEQPNEGMTLIEKLERHSEVAYAFILLTPDDLGCDARRVGGDWMFTKGLFRSRARQNVVFEFGRFVGLLGRRRVCCLYSGNLELPSDVQGLVYIPFKNSISECQVGIVKELRAAGFQV